jgi:ABC-type phosphate transport system substrate-binding protein
MIFLKHILKVFSLAVVLMFLVTPSFADSKGVILASKNLNIDKLTKEEIERIFLGKTTILEDGTRIQVVLSTSDSKVTDSFLKDFTGKSQRRFKKYWLKLVFAGYGIAPKFFKNDEKARSYIEKQEGVIAFISDNETKGLKNLKRIHVSN